MLIATAIAIACCTLWGGLALWFRGPATRGLAIAVITAWAMLGIFAVALLLTPSAETAQFAGLCAYAAAFTGLCIWWTSIRPQQHRDWATDVSQLLTPHIDGDAVSLHNVRNFAWRTREDFTPRWETRQYNLAQMHSLDLIVSYWAGPMVAHTLASFGFADGRHLVLSVEVRRTQGQQFSALGGLFKQSELLLVAADERDIVHTRSNVRGEDVYIYRVDLPAPQRRELFLAYLKKADALRHKPLFYNSMFSNCTTLVYAMVKHIVPGIPWDYRLILSGYLPRYLYALGVLDNSRPFADLHRDGCINERARASDISSHANPDFSRIIRQGVPETETNSSAPIALN